MTCNHFMNLMTIEYMHFGIALEHLPDCVISKLQRDQCELYSSNLLKTPLPVRSETN